MKRSALPVLALGLAVLLGALLWTVVRSGPSTAHASQSIEALLPGGSGALSPTDILPGPGESTSGAGGPQRTSLTEAAPKVEASQTEAEEEGVRAARGRVVNQDSIGIAGAQVILQSSLDWNVRIPPDAELIESMRDWFTRREVVTDDEGWYQFEEPPSGRFEVAARTLQHAPGGLEEQALKKNESFEFPVIMLAPGAILEGTVVGPDGLGVAEAQLFRSLGSDVRSGWARMPGRGIPLGVTNGDGTFRLANLDPEDFTLLADAEGFLPSELSVTAVEPERTPQIVRLHLMRGLNIEGRIVDFPEERAESLIVTARPAPTEQERQLQEPSKNLDPAAHRPRSVQVAKDGSFVLTGMDSGRRYRLTAYEPNLNAKIVPGKANRPRRARELEAVYAYAGEKNVELKLHNPATLRFRVVDAVTKEALTEFAAGAGYGGTRWLQERGETVRTHEGGQVTFDNLRRYDEDAKPKIQVQATGYMQLEKEDFELEPGGELDLGDVEIQPCGILVCTVLAKETGEPIEGAGIYLAAEKGKGWMNWYVRSRKSEDLWANERVSFDRTGPSGIGRLSREAGSQVFVRATAPGFQASEEKDLIVPESGELELTIELERAAVAIVRVLDSMGDPVEGAAVVSRKLDGDQSESEDWLEVPDGQTTDSDGVYRFEDLSAGQFAFRTVNVEEDWIHLEPQAEMKRPPWVDARLVAGEIVEVLLTGPSRSTLSGTVRELGQVLDRARVKLQAVVPEGEDEEEEMYARTEEDGRYLFEGVPVGEYRLFVSHGSRLMADIYTVHLGLEPEVFDVDLGVASIEGQVVDENGEPLADVSIYVSDESGDAGSFADGGEVIVTSDEEGDPDWNSVEPEEVGNVTDSTGRYVLRGVTPDLPLRVSARSNFATRDMKKVEALARDEVLTDLDFELTRAGRCRIKVLGPEGDRRRLRFKMTLLDGSGKGESSRGSISRWRRERTQSSLRPGEWKVELFERKRGARGDGELLSSGTVSIRAEQTSEITLQVN